jgi:hypothetical protein
MKLAVEEFQAAAGPNMDIQKANPPNEGILLPAANNDETKKWMLMPAECQDKTRKGESYPAVDHEQRPSTLPNSVKSAAELKDKVRVRRPPNAFIIFANEWRKSISAQNPGEKCQQINTRLGAMWKSLTDDEREIYANMARKVDAEHKKQYPDYVYCPNAARIKKALRAEARGLKRRMGKSDKTNASLPASSFNQQVSQEERAQIKVLHKTYPTETRAAYIIPNPKPPWMLVKQESGHQTPTKGFEGQVGQNMMQGCTYMLVPIHTNVLLVTPHAGIDNHMGTSHVLQTSLKK